MLEQIIIRKSFLKKHLAAPLLKEREYKKLVVRETDITAFNPVYLVLDILVHCIPFAAVPLLQAFYLDVLKAVGFRLII